MTNKRKIYLELFNLNESSSLDDIKKRYRELAKEFHPDRNKDSNAHERFLLIKEAYEYLITNQVQNSQTVYFDNINLEKERIEKIRIAKEKLKEYYKRKELFDKNEIKKFFTGYRWRFFIFFSKICIIFLLLNLVEFILPLKIEETIVSEISKEFNSITNDKIVLIKTEKKQTFFTRSDFNSEIFSNNNVKIYKTRIFNRVRWILIENNFNKLKFETIYNTICYQLFLSVILLIPFIFYIQKKDEVHYIIIIKIILSIILPLIIFIVF